MKKIGFAADEMVKIIDAHFAPLLLYARQWDAAVAEDLVQDAFLKLLHHSHKKHCPDNVAAWLFQVVRNGAVSHFRKTSRRTQHERNSVASRMTWLEPTQETDVESAELTAMLDELPLEQRELVILRIWGGLSFDEMVTLTGMTRTTIFRKYNDALETLRKRS
jgi:RNA polymerase sigma-70 factor (ECF subfamily)